MTPAQQLALWADKLRDVAAMGGYFAENLYDKANYETVQTIAMEMMALATGETLAEMEPLRAPVFARPTPITVGDAAVIDEDGRILLIRRADNGKWAMPGGAIEVGENGRFHDATHAHEVLDVAWFAEDALPPDTDPGHASRIPEAFRVWRGDRRAYFDSVNSGK